MDLNKIVTTGFIDPDRIPWESPWVLQAMALTHYLRWLKETKGEDRYYMAPPGNWSAPHDRP